MTVCESYTSVSVTMKFNFSSCSTSLLHVGFKEIVASPNILFHTYINMFYDSSSNAFNIFCHLFIMRHRVILDMCDCSGAVHQSFGFVCKHKTLTWPWEAH